MAEELKTLVNEVTKLLDVHFNMISFDALAPDGLLQVLVDVLAKFDAMTRFEVKESEPEETIKHILVAMKKIQYQPSANESLDPLAFQRGLLDGHKRIIYPLLKWIFANKDFVRDSTYLARFLMPLSLPPEALAIPEISKLMAQYQQMVEEFMETHRAYKMSETEGKQLKELKGDNEAIELEIENVKKRIEKTQSRLDKIPNQELFLEVARGLRIEKDRQRELQAQLEEQKQALQKAYLTHERMQRELNSAKITTQSTSPEQLMDAIVEETSVLQFMVDVKLPQEVQTLEKELAVYQMVASEPNINKSYLDDLQHKIDSLNREIQGMVEAKMAATNNDNLMPFRQQASTVAKNREIAAEQLNRATKELCDTEAEIQEKQLKLQETIGEVVMRGDDLKQYVNTLRAKSSVYKQKRAELATLKNEVNDLTLTLENLKAQDPKLDFSHLDEMSTGNNSLDLSLDGPETQGIGELSRLVDGLSRAVKSTRDRVQPVSRQIRELRERVQDLREDEETKKQVSRLIIFVLRVYQVLLLWL